MKVYKEHVEIDLNDNDAKVITKLIDERVKHMARDKRCIGTFTERVSTKKYLWYVFEGTFEQMTEMRKAIRRLSRGKVRFTFVFEGMTLRLGDDSGALS